MPLGNAGLRKAAPACSPPAQLLHEVAPCGRSWQVWEHVCRDGCVLAQAQILAKAPAEGALQRQHQLAPLDGLQERAVACSCIQGWHSEVVGGGRRRGVS